MLVPADIIAGKLLVQMGLVDAELVRQAMSVSETDRDVSLDLVSRLADVDHLSEGQVARVRRYMAMFDYVRREAVTLRLIESSCPQLSREQVIEVLARIEKDRYRRRLLAVLVDAGQLSMDLARQLDGQARQRIQREDFKVLQRYRGEGFRGVARPLLPVSALETAVFNVTKLFRSPDTLRFVKATIARLEAEEVAQAEEAEEAEEIEEIGSRTMPMEFVPVDMNALRGGDSVGEETGEFEEIELPQVAPEERARMETARWRKPAPEEPEAGLRERKTIGAYHVVECLGQGGMGAVYLAQEEGLGPMVAVKVVLAGKAKPDDLARFRREAEVCALLDHENVVHLIERGRTDDGLDFMVIPFFVGRDLKAVVKEKGPLLEPAFVFELVEQLLEGLESIHRKGVVHRDLKPENVFVLSGTNQVKLVDFGIARLLDHDKPPEERLFESKAGVISGSPAYVAPETVAGGAVDARTDIYSLGIMLYELLTGRLPLFAETPYDYLSEHLVGVPLTLFQGKKDASWHDELEQLMASMLAKEPGDRPPSCQAILDLLRGGLRERVLEQLAHPPPADEGDDGLFNTFFKMLKR